jgi:pimeloyl-ACP methyl ester carboxylesterase
VSVFLLLPGAGGESWYWHLVAALLRDRGHDVISPDLPAADDAAGLREYADVALDAIGDGTGLVVVAQSMGAFVAPQLILVAPMIPATGESPGGWWMSSGQLPAQREQDEREGRDPDAPFDVMTAFFHDVPQEVVDEAFARGEPRQSDRPFEETWPLDAWPDVPTRVIVGSRDRLFPLEFMRGLARERLGVEADVIDSGHLPALSRPEELAERLESYAG